MDVVRGEEGVRWWRRSVRPDVGSIARAPPHCKCIGIGTIGAMRIAALVIGTLLVLAGLVWIAQGLNLPLAPRSFMTADRTWVLLGAVTAVAGAALVGWSRSRRSPPAG
jgi:hypothetical protein